MRRKLVALVAALAIHASPLAAAQAAPDEPVFTSAEPHEVGRDATLSSLMESDRWSVRHYLDAVAATDGTTVVTVANADDDRTLPEAAWDLFQIMKRAGSPPKPPPVKK